MARLKSNLLQGISGAVGKQLVFKKYGDKTVVTSYPDMSNVKTSEKQVENRDGFRNAVACTDAMPGAWGKPQCLPRPEAAESVSS